MILRYLLTFKMLAFHPKNFFTSVLNGKYEKEIIFSFIAGAIYTLYLSFRRKMIRNPFYETDVTELLFGLFNNPQVRWLISYVVFFVFVSCMSWSRKSIKATVPRKIYFLTLMAPAIVGIPGRIVIEGLGYIIDLALKQLLAYSLFVGLIGISILGVSIIRGGSVWKSILLYSTFGILGFFLIGIPGLFPFLSWLI